MGKFFGVKVSEDVIVAISQYMAVNQTKMALDALKQNETKFTTLILYDGTPYSYTDYLDDVADMKIVIKKGIHSIPQLWNMHWGLAKLTGAKYLLWLNCDIELSPGSLDSMLSLMKTYDIVSPVKIDKDKDKFNSYRPIFDTAIDIVGFNDSVALFNLKKMPFSPLDEDYAPYQFEISALGFRFFMNNLKTGLDPNAVAFHDNGKDIAFSPEIREIGSSTWDKKRDLFLEKHKNSKWLFDEMTYACDDGSERYERLVKIAEQHKKYSKEGLKPSEWFLKYSIMNSDNANIIGFPCFIGSDLPKE